VVGERLRYTIEATDNTKDVTAEVERRTTGAFKRMAAAGAAIGAAVAAKFVEAVDTVEERARRLRIATGGGGEDTQALLGRLQREGLDEEFAIAGIAALQGQASLLGVGRVNEGAALALGQTAALGADARSAAQGLTQFGVRGGADVRASLEIANTQALQGNVDVGALHTALRDYGPVLSAFGLNYLESAAFILDLTQQGIDVSRVSPALNRFIRDASATGRSARQEGVRVFDEIANASEIRSAALGQEYFGAEGGLRLTAAIRSGRLGLGIDQLGIDPRLLQELDLTGVLEPTTRGRFQSLTQGILGDPTQPFTARAGAGILSNVGELPLGLGEAAEYLGGLGFNAAYGDLGGRLGDNPEVVTLLEEQNSLLRTLTERQDDLLAASRQRIEIEASPLTAYGLDRYLENKSIVEGGQ